jgi:hypothetical protein
MGSAKSKPYARMVIFGILSIVSYIGLFMNQALVMDYFTRGGIYAGLVIITAFYFSFIHGAFASNTIEVLGLMPKQSKKQ